jgi:molecular chaperone IbpA
MIKQGRQILPCINIYIPLCANKEKALMATENRYEFLKKLGVGFDTVLSVVDKLGAAYFSEDYPPFNLVKTDAETYVVQVSMVGYEKEQIDAIHEGGILTIRAAGSGKSDEAADDIYFHHGIKDGDNYIKFPISPGLRFEGAVFENNILYVTYKVRKEDEPPLADGKVQILDEIEAEELKVLSHSGRVKFDKSGKARLRKQRMGFRKYAYDSSGRPVAVMDLEDENKVDEEETEKLLSSLGSEKSKEVIEEVKAKVEEKKAEAEAKHEEVKAEVAAKVEEIHEKIEEKKAEKAEEKAEKKEAKAEKKAEDVTVEVGAPDNKPQVVEAKVNKKSDTEVSVVISDATIEVSEDVVLEKVETKPGKADVVVAIKEEDKKVLEDAAVDLKETVKEVVETLDSEPKLPEKTEKSEEKKTVLVDADVEDKPTVEVTVPKEVTSVVAVKKDEKPTNPEVPAIVVEDTSEKISDTAELVPIVTPSGNPDIVAAVEPEVKAEVEAKGGDVKDVVEKAIAAVVEDVVTAEPVDAKAVEVASEVVPVKVVEAAAKEVKTELLNKEDDTKATVEVKNEIEEPVKVVEVKVSEGETIADGKLEVVDATVEVSDGAELSVVKTEEGTTDIVVAATPEVKAEAEKLGTTVEEVVEAVVEAPVSDPKPVEEEVTVIVDKTVDDKPTVEVTTPKEVSQVVVAEVVEPEVATDAPVAVKLSDTAEDVPADAELVAVVTPKDQPDMVVAVPAEAKEKIDTEVLAEAVEKAVNQADVVVDTPVDEVAVEEASEVSEVVEKLDEIAKEPATIVVDKEAEDKPTVEVTLAAEESPEVVAVKLDENPSDPDVPAIVVEDATIEVSDTAELSVAKTEEGKADVVVAIEPEVKTALEDAGVVVEEVVAKALETNDAVPEVPVVEEALVDEVTVMVDKTDEEKPTVEVSVPDVVPQVVKAEIKEAPVGEDLAIELKPVGDAIPEDAEVVAVVTPEGNPDMVVAITPEVKAEAEAAGVANTAEVVEKALNQADVTVVATDSTTVDEAAVEEASAVEAVVEKLDEIAKEPATLVLNENDETQPTVEVTLAAEDAPQIVEVKLDENPSSADVPAIVVEDATMAVSSETAELIPVTTEEGKSDVVIAIEPEVKAELEAKDVVVEEVVADALEVNDAVPTLPEETAVAPVKEVEVKSETSDAAVTVEVPEVISQVVEVSKEGDKVSLNDTSAEISPEAELTVVETPEGLPNVVAVAAPEVKEELLAEVDLEVTEVVEKAIEEANPMVETVVDAPIEVDVSNVEVKTVSSNVTTKPVVIVKKPSE